MVIIEKMAIIRTEFEGIEVIKIANSPFYARSLYDHFIDVNIDDLFEDIISEKKPDLIHFQHVAYFNRENKS